MLIIIPSSIKFNEVCNVRPKGDNREKNLITLSNGEIIPNKYFHLIVDILKYIEIRLLIIYFACINNIFN